MILRIYYCETPTHKHCALWVLVTVGALAFKFMS
jgi:hypothetical protein